MPDLPARPKTATRPVLREADYAARGRRVAERKAAEYRRARDLQAARGEAELWAWVPAAHAELIRDVVADLCTALKKGETSPWLLSWMPGEAAPPDIPGRSGSNMPGAAVDGVAPAGHGPGEDADDPAAWRGMGLAARRRAQARRARARKAAAGLKRLRLVVPEAFKPRIASFLEELGAGLEAGMLPLLTLPPAAGTIPDTARVTEKIETAATIPSSFGHHGSQAAVTSGVTPARGGESGSSLPRHPIAPQVPPMCEKVPALPSEISETRQTGRRGMPERHWAEDLPIGGHQQASILFDDIQALDRLPGLLRAGSSAEERDR